MKKTYTFTNTPWDEAIDQILEYLALDIYNPTKESEFLGVSVADNYKWALAMCRDGMTYAIVRDIKGQYHMVNDETDRVHALAFQRNDTELQEAIAWDMVGDTRLW